jgi:hypothetical protein
MGIYSDYLDRQLSFEQLCSERKNELQKIATIRNRSVLVHASDVAKESPRQTHE